LAEKLKQEFGVEVKLIASSGGVFEVRAAEKLLFSKKGLGRFPEDGEVEKLVQGEVG
jgi:selenoprotein W-related protein